MFKFFDCLYKIGVDTSSLESFIWMGITLAVFKIVGNISVEKDKSFIVAKCLDIWSLTRCKIWVGILLGPQDINIDRWYYFANFFFICGSYYKRVIVFCW